MTVRWISVTLGSKRDGSNAYEGSKIKHTATQTGDVTIAWDDAVVTNKDALVQGVRIAMTQALGTLPS